MKSFAKTVSASIIAAFLLTSGLSMIGCNTVEGVGKDTKSAGKAIENTAKDAKD